MLDLPAAPPACHRSVGIVLKPWEAARICVTVEHHQRGGARRMFGREQRSGRERGGEGEKNCFSAPEIVEHRGDAVSPLLQGGQRIRGHRVRCACAQLVDEDQPTERCDRLNPPLKGR
jgi:hypothetical protein